MNFVKEIVDFVFLYILVVFQLSGQSIWFRLWIQRKSKFFEDVWLHQWIFRGSSYFVYVNLSFVYVAALWGFLKGARVETYRHNV